MLFRSVMCVYVMCVYVMCVYAMCVCVEVDFTLQEHQPSLTAPGLLQVVPEHTHTLLTQQTGCVCVCMDVKERERKRGREREVERESNREREACCYPFKKVKVFLQVDVGAEHI